jgi:hypothetical protein
MHIGIGWGLGTGQSWENVGGIGITMGPPNCLAWGSQLHCYFNNEARQLSVKWWDGAWHQQDFWPALLAGWPSNIPSCVVWGPEEPDQLHCFTINTLDVRTLMHKGWWDGVWHDWQDLDGGELASDPDCVAWGLTKANQLHCFALDDNGHLQHKGWWDGGWHAWENLKGPSNVKLTGTPECVGWGKELHCFVIGSDGNLYRRGWVDGAWQLTW